MTDNVIDLGQARLDALRQESAENRELCRWLIADIVEKQSDPINAAYAVWDAVAFYLLRSGLPQTLLTLELSNIAARASSDELPQPPAAGRDGGWDLSIAPLDDGMIGINAKDGAAEQLFATTMNVDEAVAFGQALLSMAARQAGRSAAT